jgi:GNAT superfamily N-acetyltransferase
VADPSNAAQLEARAARAWPALCSERLDGWLLRRTPAVRRRRSNSALPLGHNGASVETVERFYRAHGMTPLVHVAPAEELGGLDGALAERGWVADGETDILVARELVPGASPGVEVTVRAGVDRAWVDAWVAAEGRPDAQETSERVLARIPAPAGFALARIDGAPAGVGIAACDTGWSGVFCMATVPAMRRRGVARAVVGALWEWSRGHGAGAMYLQVERDNPAARALYTSLRFTRSHGYHFRVAP